MHDVFPDRNMEHPDKIAWMIESKGWALEPVAPDASGDPPVPAYSYTIGFESSFHFPEIAVFGLTPAQSANLVELVAELVSDHAEIPIDAVFTGLLDNDLRCALVSVDVDEHDDLFPMAVEWNGAHAFRLVQLMWPDRAGWLPWEPGFDNRLRYVQPVLGEVPA